MQGLSGLVVLDCRGPPQPARCGSWRTAAATWFSSAGTTWLTQCREFARLLFPDHRRQAPARGRPAGRAGVARFFFRLLCSSGARASGGGAVRDGVLFTFGAGSLLARAAAPASPRRTGRRAGRLIAATGTHWSTSLRVCGMRDRTGPAGRWLATGACPRHRLLRRA